MILRPTCCRCCTLKFGAITLIVLHYIVGIWVFLHKCWLGGANNFLFGIFSTIALRTQKKRWAVTSVIILFIGAIIYFVLAILLLVGAVVTKAFFFCVNIFSLVLSKCFTVTLTYYQ